MIEVKAAQRLKIMAANPSWKVSLSYKKGAQSSAWNSVTITVSAPTKEAAGKAASLKFKKSMSYERGSPVKVNRIDKVKD